MNLYSVFGRTTFGKRFGALQQFSAHELLVDLVKWHSISQKFPKIDYILTGISRNADVGPAFHLQMKHALNLPKQTIPIGVNHGCMTGMQLLVESSLRPKNETGTVINLITASESLSNCPLLAKNQKNQVQPPSNELVDHNLKDGYLCPVSKLTPLEQVAQHYNLVMKFKYSRHDLDEYAVNSHIRANKAWDSGIYNAMSVFSPPRSQMKQDETIRPINSLSSSAFGVVPGLFSSNVSASNSCSPGDGAAFLMAGSEKTLYDSCGNSYPAIAKLIGNASGNSECKQTFLSVFDAIDQLLKNSGLAPDKIDIWELSDPFAALGLMYLEKLKMKPETLNRYGGTIPIGHPSAVTGLRLVQNALIAFIQDPSAKYAICGSPGIMGMGMAILLQRA